MAAQRSSIGRAGGRADGRPTRNATPSSCARTCGTVPSSALCIGPSDRRAPSYRDSAIARAMPDNDRSRPATRSEFLSHTVQCTHSSRVESLDPISLSSCSPHSFERSPIVYCIVLFLLCIVFFPVVSRRVLRSLTCAALSGAHSSARVECLQHMYARPSDSPPLCAGATRSPPATRPHSDRLEIGIASARRFSEECLKWARQPSHMRTRSPRDRTAL